MEYENSDMEISYFNSDYYPLNNYKEARDSFLKKIFPDKQNQELKRFELSFSIGSSAKNGYLIYCILDKIPREFYVTNKNKVEIIFLSEYDLITYSGMLSDILMIVKNWKSTELYVNNIGIGATTEYGYLIDYIFEKNNRKCTYYRHSIDEIKKKYNTHKKPAKKQQKIENPILISRNNVVAALKNVIDKYIEIYGQNKEITFYSVSEYDEVVVLEDSLVIDFRLTPRYWRQIYDEDCKDWEFPYIMIQELTHNDLYKFNFANFQRYFVYSYIGLEFYAYHGVHYYVKEIDNYDMVNKVVPNLRLQERAESYPGDTHHFVILRMENAEGKIIYGVGDTKGKVHTFILKLCKELEEKNSRSLELNGASCLRYSENREFVNAFLSWKGNNKRWRLENKFSYYYEDRQVKNDLELFRIPSEIIQNAINGKYDGCDFGSYNKPLNRWKSEELVYNITKKLYKDYQVIYQFKPFFLSTDRGNMSYDIYICGLKIAIEYQGKQHFEPVDYFGGMDNFLKQQERDKLKAKLSEENGIRLIYVNYWEDITPELIKTKIEGG